MCQQKDSFQLAHYHIGLLAHYHINTLFIMATKQEKMEAFGQLLDILDELRVKCPWDRKQTNESLRTNTIEETYELCDAIMKDDNNNIKKELGDLLLHIVFYAKIGEEKAAFSSRMYATAFARS